MPHRMFASRRAATGGLVYCISIINKYTKTKRKREEERITVNDKTKNLPPYYPNSSEEVSLRSRQGFADDPNISLPDRREVSQNELPFGTLRCLLRLGKRHTNSVGMAGISGKYLPLMMCPPAGQCFRRPIHSRFVP